MSRQLEQNQEDKRAHLRKKGAKVLDYGLEQSIHDAGALLTGFSVKFEEWGCVVTLRADFNGTPMVAFSAADSLFPALIKAERALKQDKTVWKVDKYYRTG